MLEGYDASIDISMLYAISEDDDTYIRKMVETFLANMPVTLQKIEAAISSNNWDEVYKSAHYAKSSLSVIKVQGMNDNMLRIELNAKHRTDLPHLPQLLNTINREFENARKLLQEKFELLD